MTGSFGKMPIDCTISIYEIRRIHGAHSNVLGIDLGVTCIIDILTDLNGRALDRIYFEIRPGWPLELNLEQMKSIAGSLLALPKASAEVRAAGICVPGYASTAGPDDRGLLSAQLLPKGVNPIFTYGLFPHTFYP